MGQARELPETFTLAEVADRLKVSERSLYKFRSRGWLRISYLGGSRKNPRVFRCDLEDFLARSRDTSSPRVGRKYSPKKDE